MGWKTCKRLVIIPFLFFILCGATENSLPIDQIPKSYAPGKLITEKYDLMNFPARPRCFSVDDRGQVAVGYNQAGKTYFSIIKDHAVVQTYQVEMEGSYVIVLDNDILTIYAIRALHDMHLNLETGELQAGQMTRNEKIGVFENLESKDEIACGKYHLVSRVVDGHYQLQLNGETVLQCSFLVTNLTNILIGLAVPVFICMWVGAIRQYRRLEKDG